MKKVLSLAVLTAVLAGCTDLSTTDTSTMNGYGADGFGEETLVTTDESLNNTYLLAPAPKYYVGSAYKVEDVQYIPVEDLTYNQTGVAGIIPAELNGTKTSNGEVFDMSQMVATSKTLPLPTIARVTNLDNGQSVVVRVNNRGPFVNTRIMDLSPAAAQKIGMNGQTKVQVQVMANESIAVKNATIGASTPAQPVQQPAPVVETTVVTTTTAPGVTTTAPATAGEYSVQVAAFYAQDSADSLASRMAKYGNAVVVQEGDMYKVRIVNLDASQARSVIDALRSNEGMAPGLLRNGRWINADSI
ncbi:MAG TPA: septal ring lytic transglycosylase RlpA family protein [Candidatus Enterousia intestinigallinarum]|uniref:Endolytic peptidoglycan transglycosylase RlpA n=1 Tax=Candidatus Enterousia intestinigallinarum TaxID=2840790 RepID=A0A9D1FF59_9PROT|nr:septal ring lytic transglycosylase RlpA family protein [Candidatus Enterousia intestinigallinarum]